MSLHYDFTGQVALVTGASFGIGRATAQAYADARAAVVLADISHDAVYAAADELTMAGHQALAVVCDVSSKEQVAELVDIAVATYGRVDMAFNNIGVQALSIDATDESADFFDQVTAINLRGVWACMQHELRHMGDQSSGAIVNCISLGGPIGLAGRAAYQASEQGVIGLTRSAALEYSPRGIRINAICPGLSKSPTVTDVTAQDEPSIPDAIANQSIGTLDHADEIAAAVLWLNSDAASLIVGVALPVDGGYTIR